MQTERFADLKLTGPGLSDGIGLSKIKKIGEFHDKGSLQNAAAGVAKIVVDQEEIAQRVVDDIEAYVGAHLAGR